MMISRGCWWCWWWWGLRVKDGSLVRVNRGKRMMMFYGFKEETYSS